MFLASLGPSESLQKSSDKWGLRQADPHVKESMNYGNDPEDMESHICTGLNHTKPRPLNPRSQNLWLVSVSIGGYF